MNRSGRVILMTFNEGFTTTLVGRGVFFYTVWRLSFSDAANLWLAAAYGTTYVLGALTSHRLARLSSEKAMLMVTASSQFILHLLLAWRFEARMLFAVFSVLGVMSGLRWPVVESYVSAGLTPRQTSRALGRFNLAWAAAVPLGLAATGPISKLLETGLFLIPAAVNLTSILLTIALPTSPAHLPHDHPERPSRAELARIAALLTSSRWLLMTSYATAWALSGLMPIIFYNMGFETAAPALAAVMDFVRLLVFIVLIAWAGWHGRASLLVISLIAMPLGFFMVLFAGDLTAALTGEFLFGLSCGLVYYAALYYAMVAENASVGAGGKHESLIGLGFVIGPGASLVGLGLAGVFGNRTGGLLLGLGPLFAITTMASLWALRTLLPARRPAKP